MPGGAARNNFDSIMTTQAVAKQEKDVKPFDQAKGFLGQDTLRKQIAVALPRHLTPDRMLRVALTAVMDSPKLQDCFTTKVGQASVAKSLLKASQLGLEVDGRQGHLVPFNNKKLGAMLCQFIPGYQGLIDLSYNHQKVKAIWAEVVHEKDYFVEKKGSERTLVHEPYDGEDDPGQLKAAYAVCEMDNGAKTWVVLRKRDIARIMSSSASARYDDSIWKVHPEAMWKKSAIRQLSKFMPQSSQLRDALEVDDEAERTSTEVNTSRPVFENAESLIGDGSTEPNSDEAAEAAMGLAPTNQKKEEPQKKEDLQPADNPPSQADKTEVKVERAALAGVLQENGFTYQDLQTWARRTAFYPDADSYGSIDELPTTVARKLLNSKQGLITQLKQAKGGA